MVTTKVAEPEFGIIAGPNGAGKTSFVSSDRVALRLLFPGFRDERVLNPDDVARLMGLRDPSLDDKGRYMDAFRFVQEAIQQALKTRTSVYVETVLSTEKYMPVLLNMKKAGFRTGVIYIGLRDPGQSAERVHNRVDRGGHTVPEDKIVERFQKSIHRLPAVLQAVDKGLIISNVQGGFRPVGFKAGRNKVIILRNSHLPWLESVLRKSDMRITVQDPQSFDENLSQAMTR